MKIILESGKCLLVGFITEGRYDLAMQKRLLIIFKRRVYLYVFFLYPIYFLYPVFSVQSNAQMGEIYFGTFKATDIAGAIRNAWVLKSMNYPWSFEYVTNYPTGESFWRWQNYTQFFQLTYTWVMTRFLSPSFVVASIILIGWVFTGFVIYRCSIKLKVTPFYAVIAGLIWQILPWAKAKATTQTTYMFIGLLLLNILFLTDSAASLKKKWTKVALLHLFTILFDPYIFFMMLLIDVLYLLVINYDQILFKYNRVKTRSSIKAKVIRKINFKNLLILITSVISSQIIIRSILEYWLMNTEGNTSSRNLKIATKDEITPWLGSFSDYINPPTWHFLRNFYSLGGEPAIGEEFRPDLVNYAGTFVIAFSVLGLFMLIKKRLENNFERTLMFVSVIFLLISVKINIPLTNLSLIGAPLSDFLAPIMPGVRVFSRFGLIAQACMCIFAAYALFQIQVKFRSIWIPLLLSMVMVIDLAPWTGRSLSEETQLFREFNRLIQLEPDESLVQLPLGGRAWLDQAFLFKNESEFRTTNSLYSNEYNEKMQSAIESGSESFRSLLSELKIKYVIIAEGSPKPYDQSLAEPLLTKDFFTLLATTKVSGSEPDYRVDLMLYQYLAK